MKSRKKNSTSIARTSDTYAANISWLPSLNLLHWLGYGLLLLTLFDLVEILYPLDLMNLTWKFQVFGKLITRLPFLLIGLVVVFIGEKKGRKKWEFSLLYCISWLTLILALFLFLLIPLGVTNTIRLDRVNNRQITEQVNQQINEIQQVKQQLEKVNTPTEMTQLLNQFPSQGQPPTFQNYQQVAEAKKKLATSISSSELNIKIQGDYSRLNQRQTLWKNSIKWNLGALVSGVLLLGIWKETKWVR